jgi:pSer/pThr/pTyr-binding forkhead associated (FHA) protein/S1-C subfamily serine protease
MSDSSQGPRLVFSDGKEVSVAGRMFIGRSPECPVHLEGVGVSRQHALIEVVEQKVILTDLGSRNGTWLNDRKIDTPTELGDGDRLRISKIELQFRVGSATLPTRPHRPAPQTVIVSDSTEVTTAHPVALHEKRGTALWPAGIPTTFVRSDTGAEFGINRNIKIGREASNDLVLEKDASASAQHAQVELVSGKVVLSDLGSANGTWVNGKRILSPTALEHGDRIRIGDAVFRLRVGDRPLPPLDGALQPLKTRGQRWVLPLVGVGILGLGALILLLFGGLLAWPRLEANRSAAARAQALRALVVVIVPVGDVQNPQATSAGSGSLLSKDGFVLTNYHVLADTKTGQYYNQDGVALIGLNWQDPQAKPDTFYLCRIVAVEADLDLALLQAIATAQGAALPADLSFPFIQLGNSDRLAIGDPITILGYPGTGMTTPTITNGVVSGFFPAGDLAQGWIKTDAEISSGNSGGMAIDEESRLVGIPTIVVTGETSLGKIGYVRPINLALPFLHTYLP